MGKLIDLTGMKFNHLTVLRRDRSNRNTKSSLSYWECECDYLEHNHISVRSDHLRKGATTQCKSCSAKALGDRSRRNLHDQIFGNLTAISPTELRNRRCVIWKCLCKCGEICYVSSDALLQGKTTSCGCSRRKDLTNLQFGNLTALRATENRTNDRAVIWECVCKCGNTCFVSSGDLLKGYTQSCGCIKSLGEQKISAILQQEKIPYVKEKTFEDCINPETQCKLRYDFYLPNYNRLIEFDGKQHFEEPGGAWTTLSQTQFRDQIKNNYAKANKISLVRIPYQERDNITLDMILGDQYAV